MSPRVDRRTFLRAGLAGTAGLGLDLLTGSRQSLEAAPADGEMPKRPLGRTGHRVAIFSLGGQATLEKDGGETRDASIAIIHRALDLGVNYCDTAPLYGPSQDY